MGQYDILELLKKNKNGLTTTEIMNKLNLTRPTVSSSCRKLLHIKDIWYKIVKKSYSGIEYKYFINNINKNVTK